MDLCERQWDTYRSIIDRLTMPPVTPIASAGTGAPSTRIPREAIVTHMKTYDHPADRVAIVETAQNAGWRWEWLWRGHHNAEAVALLTVA